MISQERLEKLIEKNIPIYGIDYRRCLQPDIVEISVRNLRYCPSNDNYQYLSNKNRDCYLYEFFNEDLYETKEDAEFAKEFQNITREEVLNLPTWEIFIQLGIPFEFTNKNGEWFCLESCDIAGIDKIVIYHKIGFISNIFSAPTTKENYIDACKIAKKLFLGEDKNN